MLVHTLQENQAFDDGYYIGSLSELPIKMNDDEIKLINDTLEKGNPYLLKWRFFGDLITMVLIPD